MPERAVNLKGLSRPEKTLSVFFTLSFVFELVAIILTFLVLSEGGSETNPVTDALYSHFKNNPIWGAISEGFIVFFVLLVIPIFAVMKSASLSLHSKKKIIGLKAAIALGVLDGLGLTLFVFTFLDMFNDIVVYFSLPNRIDNPIKFEYLVMFAMVIAVGTTLFSYFKRSWPKLKEKKVNS